MHIQSCRYSGTFSAWSMDKQDKETYARIALLGHQMESKGATKEGLDELYKFCKDKKYPIEIRKVAILSVLAVLESLIPDYVVAKHSAKDNVSREVRDRRAEEKVLLDFTRRFIQYCELVAFGRDNNIKLRVACAKSLSILFEKKRRYNTGEQLAKTVVRLACSPVALLKKYACQAIVGVFKSDPTGEFTLKIMTKVAETPTPKISSELLGALKEVELKPVSGKVEKPKLEDKELQRELKEVGIIDHKEELQHNQVAILEHLFGTVFRFLRETKSEEHFCKSMEVVKKYVDHINIDVVPQIVEALKQKRFSLQASIIAANTALSVCASAQLVVDLRSFYASVYARAYEALDDRQVLLQFLALFDMISQQIDKSRTASFAKRLMTMALQSMTDIQGTILAYIRQMVLNEPSMTRALDFEFEAAGEFSVVSDDPDSCNGPSAKYWELVHLANSPNKFVSAIATELASLTDINAIRNVTIAAANQKRDWSPAAILEQLDYSKRVFDVHLLVQPVKPLPKTFKVFEFDE